MARTSEWATPIPSVFNGDWPLVKIEKRPQGLMAFFKDPERDICARILYKPAA